MRTADFCAFISVKTEQTHSLPTTQSKQQEHEKESVRKTKDNKAMLTTNR